MADTTISACRDLSSLRSSRSGIVWTSDQVGYIFYINSSTGLVYRKTTNAGVSWNAEVIMLATSGQYAVHAEWYDQWTTGDSGTKIHIIGSSWANDRVDYINLETATDTLSSTTIAGSLTTGQLGDIDTNHTSITKSRGGNLYVYGQTVTANLFARSTDVGANWTGRSSPFEANEDRCWLTPSNDTDNNDIAAIYLDDSADELTFKLHDDSANTWGNETSIDTAMKPGGDWPGTYFGISVVVRHSDGVGVVCYWNDVNSSTADLKCKTCTLLVGGSVTAKTNLLTDVNTAGYVDTYIDHSNDKIYVAYIHGGTWLTSVDVYYKSSTDGGTTWGTETQYDTGSAGGFQAVYLGNSVKAGQRGRFMPAWVDETNDLILTNSANSIATGDPLISAQPQSQTVALPSQSTATFTVTATGVGSLTYQWKKNGANVGTNSSSYTTPALDMTYNKAVYTVDVTDSNATFTSNNAVLTVAIVPAVAWLKA